MPAVLPDGLDDRRRAAARGSARRRGAARQLTADQRAVSLRPSAMTIDRRSRRAPGPVAVDRHGQRAADRAARPGCFPERVSRRFAATSTRGLRKLDDGRVRCAGAGGRRTAAARVRVAHLAGAAGRRVRAGAGSGHRRHRDPRRTTTRVRRAVARINDAAAAAALTAERAVVEALGGGCQTPIGALATPVDGRRARARRRSSWRSTAAEPSAAGAAGRGATRPSSAPASARSCSRTAPARSWQARATLARGMR